MVGFLFGMDLLETDIVYSKDLTVQNKLPVTNIKRFSCVSTKQESTLKPMLSSAISFKYNLPTKESGMCSLAAGNKMHSRLLLPVLALSVLSTWLITVTFQLLLIEVSQTFNVQVGTASMMASVGAISGAAFGILMAILSVRFNHKYLLLIGLGCTCLAALGFYAAPTFLLILLPNIGVGAGIAIVTSMAYSIVGDHYPLEKRGRAIGVLVAAITLAYVVGAPSIGLVADLTGWRAVMLLIALPFAFVSLILTLFVVPNKALNPLCEKEPFSTGCKRAFSNRSAVAALTVTMLMLCESAIGYYSVSFFREQFSLSVIDGSFFVLVGNIVGTVGGAVSGLMVNRVGRKRLGTVTLVMAGLLTLSFMFLPTLEVSWVLGIVRFWFSTMAFTAGGALIIEQLPKFRSTMMSLNAAFMNLGMLLASVAAGLILNFGSYQAVGITLGTLGILGAAVWIRLVKEPVQ